MFERPPDFVDLDDEEPLREHAQEERHLAPEPMEDMERPADSFDEAASPEEADDAEPAGDDEADDDVIGRAAAVLKYIVEHIVDDPNQISIGATSDDRGPVLLLSVGDDDRGKVIGRQGRIVQAIRTIVKAATVGTGERVNVEIVD